MRFKKGNQASKKDVTKSTSINIRVTQEEKHTIDKVAGGNVSRYFLKLHRENIR